VLASLAVRAHLMRLAAEPELKSVSQMIIMSWQNYKKYKLGVVFKV
jgi:hypothetical protein